MPAGAAGDCFSFRDSSVLTFIQCSFHPRVTAAFKEPRSFRQKCRWQVTTKHAYTLDPTKSEWAVQAYSVGTCKENDLTRNSSGNARQKSAGSVCCGLTLELVSTNKKEKKCRRYLIHPKILGCKEKATTTVATSPCLDEPVPPLPHPLLFFFFGGGSVSLRFACLIRFRCATVPLVNIDG